MSGDYTYMYNYHQLNRLRPGADSRDVSWNRVRCRNPLGGEGVVQSESVVCTARATTPDAMGL